MKLSTRQIEITAGQIGALAVPIDHPVIPQLNRIYGEHTFFLDEEGLEILEAVEPVITSASASAMVVKLASWSDAKRTTLAAHEPEATDTIVILDNVVDGYGDDE